MGIPLAPILRTAAWAVAVPLGLYVTFLGLGMTPFFQRHFFYAHRISLHFLYNPDYPEQWGFAKGQVTPFSMTTPDDQNIYAWHVLPLPLYLKNEEKLSQQKSGFCDDFTATDSFRMIKEDPDAKIVLYFHGNAGHVAQHLRPDSYHVLTDTSSYHAMAIDYRGYGHSTGSPTEHGLIQDAATLIDFVINVVGIPSERIVLLGQSLGTAVTAAAAELYAAQGIEFAGVILVAGFSSLAKLLNGYRIGGFFPVLGPLRVWPGLLGKVEGFVVDKWHSADRLASLVQHTKKRLRLSLIAAKNDRDIPCSESDKLFRSAANATVQGGLDDHSFAAWKEVRTIKKGDDAFVTTWTADPDIVIRQELFPYGGHNEIMAYAPVVLAVMRSFDLEGTVYT